MAAQFTVSDGTGLTTANSYVSDTDADQYHENHGNPAAWSGATVADKQNGLREATAYLDAKFEQRWKGARANELQALDWPRMGAWDADGYAIESDGSTSIPQNLKDAATELALKVIAGDSLFEDSTPGGTAGGGVQREKVKVGSIEEDITYVASKASQKRYTLVERLIAGLLLSRGSVRA